MATRIVSEGDLDEPVVRRKSVSVTNDGTMRAVIDAGEFGTFVTDEPEPHGGSGQGARRCRPSSASSAAASP